MDAAQIRTSILLSDDLEREAKLLQPLIDGLETMEDIELRQTFRRSAQQLDSVQDDLRKRLARLAPGDPEGMVDLSRLAERLDQREAKQEVGVATDTEIPSQLTVKTSPGNLGAAAFMGVFGLGWNAFTLFHATLMIGAMYKAFGIAALALLAFYAIFFTVGFGMLWMAFRMACREEVDLDGNALTVRRSLGPIQSSKRHQIDPHIPAIEGTASTGFSGRTTRRHAKPTPAIVLTDSEGRPIEVGLGASDAARQESIRKINAYLAAQPRR